MENENLSGGNLDPDNLPFEVLIYGKPLRNPDGSVFMVTNNSAKKLYESGGFFVVAAAEIKDQNQLSTDEPTR